MRRTNSLPIWRTATAAIVIASATIALDTSAVSAADISDPGLLTSAESDFLLKNCPETTQVIQTGAVVAYGRIIAPPILVAVDRDMIYLGGIKVLPREQRHKAYRAMKLVDEIQIKYFLEKGEGKADALTHARQSVIDAENSGAASKFEIKGEKQREIRAIVGEQEWDWVLDACPRVMMAKNRFVVWQLCRSYTLRKQSEGKDAALSWIRARFNDLKSMGILASYDMHDRNETVYLNFSCFPGKWGTGFYDPDTDHAKAYEKAWKLKEADTRHEVSDIVRRLKAGELLIYSYDFDTHLPLKPSMLELLRHAHASHDDSSVKKDLQDALGVTPKQADALFEELE